MQALYYDADTEALWVGHEDGRVNVIAILNGAISDIFCSFSLNAQILAFYPWHGATVCVSAYFISMRKVGGYEVSSTQIGQLELAKPVVHCCASSCSIPYSVLTSTEDGLCQLFAVQDYGISEAARFSLNSPVTALACSYKRVYAATADGFLIIISISAILANGVTEHVVSLQELLLRSHHSVIRFKCYEYGYISHLAVETYADNFIFYTGYMQKKGITDSSKVSALDCVLDILYACSGFDGSSSSCPGSKESYETNSSTFVPILISFSRQNHQLRF